MTELFLTKTFDFNKNPMVSSQQFSNNLKFFKNSFQNSPLKLINFYTLLKITLNQIKKEGIQSNKLLKNFENKSLKI